MVAQLLGWYPVQQPLARLAPAYRPRSGQIAESGRDRRPVGADQVGEALVREGQVHQDPVAADPAPALGHMPEGEQDWSSTRG